VEICENICDGSWVPGMDQKSEFAATLATAFAKVLVTGCMKKSGMVLATAPARVPAMDRMMESASVLVMVGRTAAAIDRK